MITNVSLTTIYCLDQTAARDFYTEKLGFEPRTDAEMWPGARWVTVGHPDHPELEITLMLPGPPLSDEAAAFVRDQLGKGAMGGLGLQVDDARATYEELSAKGVEFTKPPTKEFYGYEALFKDDSGNWFSLGEKKAE